MFIQQARIAGPPPLHHNNQFAGDNHANPIKGGPARLYSYAVVDLCSKKMTIGRHDTNPFIEFIRNTQYLVGRLKDDPNGSSESYKLDNGDVMVRIIGKAHNRLVMGSPDIDYVYIIRLQKQDNKIIYDIKGAHDGFPAYSIFIGGTNVYFWDAVSHGTTIGFLCPPMDVDVEKS
jgi:hypothetical protein